MIFSTSWRFLCIKLVARIYSSNALSGCCDEIHLSVEFVTVGFKDMPAFMLSLILGDTGMVSWRADEATPERGTPINER